MELPRVYTLLNCADNNNLKDVCTMLANANWLWTGNAFISLDCAAFVSLVQAALWLVAVPLDAAFF